jgi:serine/threonine protein kinase
MGMRALTQSLLAVSLLVSAPAFAGKQVMAQAHDGQEHTYELDKELAHGWWSSASLAHDVATNDQVVVKVLRDDRLKDGSQDSFDKEDEILHGLEGKHTAFPRTLGTGHTLDDAHNHALVLEKLDGEQLGAHMQRPVGKSVRIGMRILDSLGPMHATGWVHWDLQNPANILINANQESASVKLLDVGNAVRIDPQHQPSGDVRQVARLVQWMATGSDKMDELHFRALDRYRAGNTTLGMVIRNGWAGRYQNTAQLKQALQQFSKL